MYVGSNHIIYVGRKAVIRARNYSYFTIFHQRKPVPCALETILEETVYTIRLVTLDYTEHDDTGLFPPFFTSSGLDYIELVVEDIAVVGLICAE
jgi:hypothetical protein